MNTTTTNPTLTSTPNLNLRAEQGRRIEAGTPNGRRAYMDQLKQDIGAYVRSGACDTDEGEGYMIEAFAKLRGLTFRQAERIWIETLSHA